MFLVDPGVNFDFFWWSAISGIVPIIGVMLGFGLALDIVKAGIYWARAALTGGV